MKSLKNLLVTCSLTTLLCTQVISSNIDNQDVIVDAQSNSKQLCTSLDDHFSPALKSIGQDILSYVHSDDLKSVHATCKFLNHVMNQETFWLSYFMGRKDFGLLNSQSNLADYRKNLDYYKTPSVKIANNLYRIMNSNGKFFTGSFFDEQINKQKSIIFDALTNHKDVVRIPDFLENLSPYNISSDNIIWFNGHNSDYTSHYTFTAKIEDNYQLHNLTKIDEQHNIKSTTFCHSKRKFLTQVDDVGTLFSGLYNVIAISSNGNIIFGDGQDRESHRAFIANKDDDGNYIISSFFKDASLFIRSSAVGISDDGSTIVFNGWLKDQRPTAHVGFLNSKGEIISIKSLGTLDTSSESSSRGAIISPDGTSILSVSRTAIGDALCRSDINRDMTVMPMVKIVDLNTIRNRCDYFKASPDNRIISIATNSGINYIWSKKTGLRLLADLLNAGPDINLQAVESISDNGAVILINDFLSDQSTIVVVPQLLPDYYDMLK